MRPPMRPRPLRHVAIAVVALLTVACASADAPTTRRSNTIEADDAIGDGTDADADDADSGDTDSDAPDPTSTEAAPDAPPFDASLVPAMPSAPSPSIAAGADPAAVATRLVAAVADPAGDPAVAWREVYSEVGVPVIDAAPGRSVDDPVGPTWDQVWSVGRLSTRPLAIPSDEAERLISVLVAGDDASVGALAPGALLEGVRTLATSTEPRAVVLGRFLAERSVSRGLPDPLDPSTTPAQFVLDPASLALVMWTSLRATIPAAAEVAGDGAGFVGVRAARRAPPSLCSSPTDEESWVLFITKVAGSGLDVAGMGIPGISSLITNAIELGRGEGAARMAGKVLGIASLATSIVSALAAYAMVGATVSMDPSPLERLKEAREGKRATVKILISFQEGTEGTAAEVSCALNVLSRVVGAELALPAKGTPVSGVDVVPDAGRNVPSKVLFDVGSRVLTSDGGGVATLPVLGAARKKDLPDSARAIDDTFGIRVSAQFESVSAQGILDTFLGGLTLSIGGALGAAVNVLKTVRYDLGEHTLPLKDWEQESYLIDQPFGALQINGVVCSLSEPFVVEVAGELSGSITLTPAGDSGGSFAGGAPEVFLFWFGTYAVDRSDPASPELVMSETSSYVELPQVGRVDGTGNWWSNEVIRLIPDASACGS